MSGPCALAIMTKAPRAGSVKTRLSPPLTADEAAGLHACFLKDTAESIAALGADGRCSGVAVYTPEGTEQLFDGLLPPAFRMLPQRGQGFGDRLLNAASDLLEAGYGSVCLIDSDSPTVPPATFEAAAAALAQPDERLVLGPADDGGYYLIGMTVACPRLFAEIAWSTDQVLNQTIARAQEAGLDVALLPRWYDVDDGASLRRLCEELFHDGPTGGAAPGYHAPHTRDFLRRLLAVECGRPRLRAS
jgi:rSAM/selenodomain-associated transferase 1